MKKLIAILLCTLMIAAAVACKAPANEPKAPEKTDELPVGESQEAEAVPNTVDEPVEQPDPVFPDMSSEKLLGGWAVAEDVAMTDEFKAIFEKALEGLVGVDYEPIACLGTQVVAGTNYCFLAKATVVYPDATPKYVLVYIYADLEGNATIMNFADMPVVPNEYGTAEAIPEEETLDGGWAYAESPEITDEIKDKLNKALEGLVGAEYEPIANLGTQVVAGLNRCILAKVSAVVPEPVPHCALVYIYEALDGSVELLQVIDFDFGALCTYGA